MVNECSPPSKRVVTRPLCSLANGGSQRTMHVVVTTLSQPRCPRPPGHSRAQSCQSGTLADTVLPARDTCGHSPAGQGHSRTQSCRPAATGPKPCRCIWSLQCSRQPPYPPSKRTTDPPRGDSDHQGRAGLLFSENDMFSPKANDVAPVTEPPWNYMAQSVHTGTLEDWHSPGAQPVSPRPGAQLPHRRGDAGNPRLPASEGARGQRWQ